MAALVFLLAFLGSTAVASFLLNKDVLWYILGSWKRFRCFHSGATGFKQGPGPLEAIRRLGPLIKRGHLHHACLEMCERFGPAYYTHIFGVHVSVPADSRQCISTGDVHHPYTKELNEFRT